MTSKTARRSRSLLPFAALCAAAALQPASALGADPAGTLTSGPAQLVNPGAQAVTPPPAPSGVAINRPAMSMSAYRAAKAAADAAPVAARPAVAATRPFAITASGFAGITQSGAGGSFPPDVDGAAGGLYNMLVTNTHVTVYRKLTTPTVVKDVSLGDFFGYSAQGMFDPRVLYDPAWNRWIVSAEAFEESPTVQMLGLSVSAGSTPTGSFNTYLINGKAICGDDVFLDYPQIGQTQDAVIVTQNCFDNATKNYLGSAV